jgi:hypothetical protein
MPLVGKCSGNKYIVHRFDKTDDDPLITFTLQIQFYKSGGDANKIVAGRPLLEQYFALMILNAYPATVN